MAFCEYCGAPLREGASFCENCGAAAEAPAHEDAGPWPLTQTQLGIYSACMIIPGLRPTTSSRTPRIFRMRGASPSR